MSVVEIGLSVICLAAVSATPVLRVRVRDRPASGLLRIITHADAGSNGEHRCAVRRVPRSAPRTHPPLRPPTLTHTQLNRASSYPTWEVRHGPAPHDTFMGTTMMPAGGETRGHRRNLFAHLHRRDPEKKQRGHHQPRSANAQPVSLFGHIAGWAAPGSERGAERSGDDNEL